MARPKKPTAIKKIEGNRSKREIKPDVVSPDDLIKPAHLTPLAQLCWDEIVRHQVRGVYKATDAIVIGALAEEMATHRFVTAFMYHAASKTGSPSNAGLVSTGSTGQETISVYRKLQNETFNNILKGAARLGLDPVSRPNLANPMLDPAANNDGVE